MAGGFAYYRLRQTAKPPGFGLFQIFVVFDPSDRIFAASRDHRPRSQPRIAPGSRFAHA